MSTHVTQQAAPLRPSRVDATSAVASQGIDPFYRGRLNLHAGDLQEDVMRRVEEFNAITTVFVRGDRYDIRANGMLSDILVNTPVLIYDLPELKMRCDTAFVDTTGRMYFCDTFYRKLIEEQDAGKDSLFFLFRHEAEHLRRLHLQRMLDVDPDISNDAADMRINHDIITLAVGNRLLAENPAAPSPSKAVLDQGVANYIANLGEAVSKGVGMTMAEYIEFRGWSEERIAAHLMAKRAKAPQPQQASKQLDVSFAELMEGAAQDNDAIHALGLASGRTMPNHMPNETGIATPNAPVSVIASTLASELRKIGAAKGKVSLPAMQSVMGGLITIMDTMEMTDRDLQHHALQSAGAGAPVRSVSTKDAYVNGLKPRERIMLAAKLLNMVLNPSSSAGGPKTKGGMKVKDLDQMLGRGKSNDSSPGEPGTPQANVEGGGDHVMDAREVAEILERNGLHDAASKLGYDDLTKLSREEQAARQSVVGAINKAHEDTMKVGSRMPGAHMVDYAVARMNDFYKPVLTLRMAVKEVIEGAGRAQRFEEMEPWQPFYVDHSDMGLSSANDIPYMGSYVMGTTERPVVVVIMDTSGSVNDAMLKRFATEGVNFAKENDGEAAPEVVLIFADTVCRGEPVFIDENNVDQYLKTGVSYGGRGGTSFQASIEHVFEMFRPEGGGALEGRKMDALIYFTDSFDRVPDQDRLEAKAFECGLNQLPTTLFLVPQSCYNEPFAEGVKDWAATVFFNPSRELGSAHDQVNDLDMEEIEAQIEARGKRAVAPR